MCHLQTGVGERPSTHACKYDGNEVGWNSGVQGVSQNVLLYAPLIEPQLFLSRLLFFLFALVLLSPSSQPFLHGVVVDLPFRGG